MRRLSSTQLVGVVAGLVMALAAVQWLLTPQGARSATTHASSPAGLRALHLAAEELGLSVDRWQRPLHPLPRDVEAPRALAVVAPRDELRATEAAALESWVRAGGRLFYVTTWADPFVAGLGLVEGRGCRSFPNAPEHDDGECLVSEPVRSDVGRALVGGTVTEAAYEWPSFSFDDQEAEAGEILLASKTGDFAAARFVLGDGEVILLSAAEQLRNGTLGDGGAARFAVRALAHLARGETLWFDEYHHGYDTRTSLAVEAAGFLVGTDAGGALLQLGLVLIALVAAAGARFGSPIAPESGARRSSLEHVEALAAAYQGAGARRRAAWLLRETLRLRLRLSASGALDAFLTRLASARPDLGDAIGVVRAPDAVTDDAGLVRFAAAVDTLFQEDLHAARS